MRDHFGRTGSAVGLGIPKDAVRLRRDIWEVKLKMLIDLRGIISNAPSMDACVPHTKCGLSTGCEDANESVRRN